MIIIVITIVIIIIVIIIIIIIQESWNSHALLAMRGPCMANYTLGYRKGT